MPSLAVDVNSWARLACYPRGSFYPVSYDHSTLCRRITKSDFRLCAARWPCSQAGLCLCTPWLVSIQPEPTFERLRYRLGGDRPSQTAHLPLSPEGLGSKRCQAGISPATRPSLATRLLSLPAILHKHRPNAMTSCSKAPRGLFVQLRVTRIFTRTSISPSPSLRQRSARYAFRAGRNLPDKEFRYLRTVIVTAAVHRGFNSELAPLLLTFRHWAGVSPYTSACALAQTCVFGKQSAEPFHCDQPALAPLLPKLRGYVAEFLNEGSLVRLSILYSSTGVGLRYGRPASSSTGLFSCLGAPHFSLARGVAGLPRLPPPSNRGLRLPKPTLSSPPVGTGILTRCPSPALASLGLGPTNPTRTDLPSETLDFRRGWFAHPARYSCPHSHSWSLQRPLPRRLHRCHDALLPCLRIPDFGAALQPRYIFRAVAFDQ